MNSMENNSINPIKFSYDICWLRAEIVKMEFELAHSKSDSDLIIQKKMRLEGFKRICHNLQDFPHIEQYYQLYKNITELKKRDNELHSVMAVLIFNPELKNNGLLQISMPFSSSIQNISNAKY